MVFYKSIFYHRPRLMSHTYNYNKSITNIYSLIPYQDSYKGLLVIWGLPLSLRKKLKCCGTLSCGGLVSFSLVSLHSDYAAKKVLFV